MSGNFGTENYNQITSKTKQNKPETQSFLTHQHGRDKEIIQLDPQTRIQFDLKRKPLGKK